MRFVHLQRWLRDVSASSRLWLWLSWLGLGCSLALIAAFGTDTGISYDEIGQRRYGDLVLRWFESGFEDQAAMRFGDLYLYGGLFDALAQLAARYVPLPVFDTRHLLTALTALLGIVATWKLAARVGGPRAGFFAAAVLALTPVWIGHGMFNPKDIPFGTAAAFATLASLRIAIGPAPLRVRDMCLAGFTAGVALAVRPGGLFVLGYPCLAAGSRLLLEAVRRYRAGQPLQLLRLAGSLVLCVVLVVAIAWPVMVAAWPWAQLDPLRRPFEAMQVASHFHWHGTVRFEGKMIDAGELPLRYLPVWFELSLPETYFLGALVGLVLLVHVAARRSVNAERALGVALIASCVIVPFAAILLKRPVLYDAQRHVLFLVPPAAALAGCALSEFAAAVWVPRAVRAVCMGLFAAIAIAVSVDIVQLHPYEYVYFNRLHGGLRKQHRRYETDYWSTSYREGLEWVVREGHPVHEGRRTRVTACDTAGNDRLEQYVADWPKAVEHVRVVNYERADVLLAVRRFDCHKVKGKILHTIRRQDVPLLWVRQIRETATR